jgi:formiminoglutamase
MHTNPGFDRSFAWRGPSEDPHDEQFGDVVESAELDTAARYDAVLVGEPYDGAVIGRSGAREGPRAIREALAGVKSHHFGHGPVRSVGDLGSLSLSASEPGGTPQQGEDVSAVQRRVRAVTREVHETDALPVFLGGDNSLTYPNVAPLLESGDRIGAVNLDAHLDCRAVEDQPTSGSPYRQLLAAGLDSLAVVGARQFETSTAYAEFLREEGGEILTAGSVGPEPAAAADRALATLGDVDGVYVSVDMDVLDTVAAPGVSAPTPGGLTSRELFELVGVLAATDRLVGFEVVETAPPLCPDGRTAATAARVLAHALAAATTDASPAEGGNRGERGD